MCWTDSRTLNQLDQGYDRLQKGKLDDFISKTTAYADIIADIQAYKQAVDMDIPRSEEQVEEVPSSHNNIDTNPPPSSDISESEISKSGSTGSSSCSPQSQDHHDNLQNPDPSNNHLVSGSDYDIYISEDGLTHRAWYEQENELENSSDEEEGAQDFDHGLFSEGEIGEDLYLYDSD